MTATIYLAVSTEALLDANAMREPDYQLENAALRLFARGLSHSPQTVLWRLCKQVLPDIRQLGALLCGTVRPAILSRSRSKNR